MSTLAEIEAAVDRLTWSEQQSLLQHLTVRLRSQTQEGTGSVIDRHAWLEKLDRLRARGATGRTGAPLQQLMDEIRADRF